MSQAQIGGLTDDASLLVVRTAVRGEPSVAAPLASPPAQTNATAPTCVDPVHPHCRFYSFVPLTLIPIQKKLLDLSLLAPAELDWLDEYHHTVSR